MIVNRSPARTLLAAVLLVSCAGVLNASSLPEPLEAAIRDAEQRSEAAERIEFSFSMHTVTSEDEFRLRYDPSSDGFWTLESEETKDSVKMRDRMAERAANREEGAVGPDKRLLIGDLRELFGDTIELAVESSEGRIYRFSLSDAAQIGGGAGGKSFDASEYLTGELAIGADNRLRWLRFFAEESFKPMLVARINTFDLKMFVDPIWPDGPYVIVRQVIDMDGSAFFKSFSENVKTVYTDFEER